MQSAAHAWIPVAYAERCTCMHIVQRASSATTCSTICRIVRCPERAWSRSSLDRPASAASRSSGPRAYSANCSSRERGTRGRAGGELVIYHYSLMAPAVTTAPAYDVCPCQFLGPDESPMNLVNCGRPYKPATVEGYSARYVPYYTIKFTKVVSSTSR